MNRSSEGHWSRDILAELTSTALLVFVVVLSGSLQMQLGRGTLIDALVGSVSVGLGFGLILVAFGSYTGAQGNPLVSFIAAVYGGQPARGTIRLVTGQMLGGGLAAAIIGTAFPGLASPGEGYVPVHTVAEGVESFAMLLVGLGVAHRRNARVPLALGAMASASVWMTGRGTLGNPVISVSVLILATKAFRPDDILRIVSAQVLGAAIAVGVAALLFPWARESARVLLFRPRQS